MIACCLAGLAAGAQAQGSHQRSHKPSAPHKTAPPYHAVGLPTIRPSELAQDGGRGCSTGVRIITAYYAIGRRTANGQRFNPNGLTAAHRTLPFGTQLMVTNPRNGKSVSVTINDRGPFVKGVALDLSLGAAKVIGIRGTGTTCMARSEEAT